MADPLANEVLKCRALPVLAREAEFQPLSGKYPCFSRFKAEYIPQIFCCHFFSHHLVRGYITKRWLTYLEPPQKAPFLFQLKP